jgi:hypothetical protein
VSKAPAAIITGQGAQPGQILEVLHVAALVGADRHALDVLVQDRVHHLADRPVVPEVDHLRALGLQDPPDDADGGVMTVEQRGRGHEPHRMYRDAQSAPHRGILRIVWKSDATASR